MEIREEPLTAELNGIISAGFARHAIEMTGFEEMGNNVAFVATEMGEFAGAVVVQLFWGALHVKKLLVEEAYRGQGVATRLMERALQYGKENHCPFAFVETMSFQALDFYKKVGFQLEFTRPGYAHNTSFHYLKKLI